MNQKVYDAAYEEKLLEYFDEMLPEKIYDAHFHISCEYTESTGYQGDPYKQYRDFSEKYTKRDVAGGMVMPQPQKNQPIKETDAQNLYNIELAKREGLSAGLIITPYCNREKILKYLDEYNVIKAFKPYLTYSTSENMFESDILDFAPEWIWELADEKEMPVVIHLSHYQDGLSHPKNIEQIKYLCGKYTKMKLVLAHCALGHHIQKLIWGLKEIKGIPNIRFDCSGSAEAVSIFHCIKEFGVDKMMYGGDFNHAATIGRICSFGSNFIGFHEGYVNEDAVYKGYKYQPLNNAQECLLALLQATEMLNLNKNDLEKIFYDNAFNLYK